MCLVGVAMTGIEAGHIVIMLLGVCYLMFSEIYFENIGTGILEVIHIPLLCSAFLYGPVAYLFPVTYFFGTKKRLFASGVAACVVYAYYIISERDPPMVMALILCVLASVHSLCMRTPKKKRRR